MGSDDIRLARQRLPLRDLMSRSGDDPDGRKCPFCEKKGSGSLFKPKGESHELFKCHRTSCPSATSGDGTAWDEVGYLMWKQGLSRSEAFKEYLKLAGVWEDRPSQSTSKRKKIGAEKSPVNEAGESGENADEFEPEADEAEPVHLDPAADEALDQHETEVALGVEPVKVLEDFYSQLTLSPEDEALLWDKRGLTPETARALGYRSNPKTNAELLEQLRQRHQPWALTRSGLFKPDRGGIKPSGQFYGYGITGKRKDANGKDDFSWGWTHPPLIPYRDETGALVHLRPHKGMATGKSPRLYRIEPSDRVKLKYLIVTEGEFKAAALWQAFDGSAAVCALPGITMAKNWNVWEDLLNWISDLLPHRIIVAYDNEEKGDPKLPGFKSEPWRRHDAEVWARYLAGQVEKHGYDARVAHLPDTWRDSDGKADWDGVLARLVRGKKWDEVKHDARAKFARVLEAAPRLRDIEGDPATEGAILRNLRRIQHEPLLASGGDKELRTYYRLLGLCSELRRQAKEGFNRAAPETISYLVHLANAYRQVKGCYYVHKRFTPKVADIWADRLAGARQSADADLAWAYALALEGRVERVSDFTIRAHFVLVKLDGTRDRMVEITNNQGERTGLVPLPARGYSRPTEFREFLANAANAAWRAGERELQDLQQDLNVATGYKEVKQVVSFGHHAESGLWFFDQCAVTASGKELFPDKNGVIWHESTGYLLTESGRDNQDFRQGRPTLHPKLALDFDPAMNGTPKWILTEGRADNAKALGKLWDLVCSRLEETLGGNEGRLLLGSMLAYASGPEIFAREGAMGGLWVHGEMESGKTTLVSWLMELWGFQQRESGIGLVKSATVAGVQIALDQYSNLPLWLDEYLPGEVQDGLNGVIHSSFNREVASKWSKDGGQRRVLTSVVVSGEGTARRAATKSRFVHVQAARQKRQESWFDWFQEHRKFFFTLGRHVLRHRADFVASVTRWMGEWRRAAAKTRINERSRLVYGQAFGGYAAMCELLGAKDSISEVGDWLVEFAHREYGSIREQVNIDLFWQDLLVAYEAGAFGYTKSELEKYFRVHRDPHCRRDDEDAVPAYVLSLNPPLVINAIREMKRRSMQSLELDQADVRAQMSVRPYWVKGDNIRSRFGSGTGAIRCWKVRVDLLGEIGYNQCDPEELASAEGSVIDDTYVDPRKGALYSLCDSIFQQKLSEKKEEATW